MAAPNFGSPMPPSSPTGPAGFVQPGLHQLGSPGEAEDGGLGSAWNPLNHMQALEQGALVGAYKQPLIGAVIRNTLAILPGITGDDVDNYMRGIESETDRWRMGRIGELAGRWVPEIAGAAKLYSLGRNAFYAVAGLETSAGMATAADATTMAASMAMNAAGGLPGFAAATAKAGQVAGQAAGIASRVGAGAQRAATAVGQAAGVFDNTTVAGMVSQGLQSVAGRALTTPNLIRAGELVSGNVAVGAGYGVQALAEGKSPLQSVQEAAWTAAFGGMIESGIVLGGKALLRGARNIDVDRPFRRFANLIAPSKSGELSRADEFGRLRQSLHGQAAQSVAAREAAVGGMREAETGGFAYAAAAGGEKSPYYEALEQAVKAEDRRLTTLANQENAIDEFLGTSVPRGTMTSEEPIYGPDKVGMLTRFAIEAIRSPEGLKGQLGVTFAKLIRIATEAENQHQIAKRIFNPTKVVEWKDRLWAAAQQASPTKFKGEVPSDGRWALEIISDFEEGGLTQVAGKYGNGAADVVAEMRSDMGARWKRLQDIGAQESLDGAQFGVAEFWPHMAQFKDFSEEQWRANFVRQLHKKAGIDVTDVAKRPGVTDEELQVIAEKILLANKKGLQSQGSIEAQRLVPGTLKSKVDSGMPYVDDPFESLLGWMNATDYRYAYGKRFGFNGELRRTYQNMMIAEGVSSPVAERMTHVVIEGGDQYSAAMRNFAGRVTSVTTAMKMGLSFIANFTGHGQTAVGLGVQNTAKGFVDAVKSITSKDARSKALHVMSAIDNEIWQSMNRSWAGVQGSNNLLDRVGDYVLTYGGQSVTERNLRLTTAATAMHDIAETIGRGALGNVRGREHEIISRRFAKSYDLDYDALVKRARTMAPDAPMSDLLTESEMVRAAQQSIKLYQGGRGAYTHPIWWGSPVGKIMTQFKGYAYSSMRMMGDSVWSEAAKGNMRPLAYFMAISPVAGLTVREALDTVRMGDDPEKRFEKRDFKHPAIKFVDTVASAGQLGIVYGMMKAAQYGKLSDFFFGPSVSTAIGYSERLLRGDWDGLYKRIESEPTVDAIQGLYRWGGMTLGKAMDLASMAVPEIGGTSNAPMGISSLLQYEAQQQQQEPR